MEASLTKEEKLRYEKNWDRISSEKTLLSAALEEGEAKGWVKGIEKGREQEKLEIAKKLLENGMSPEKIQEITGLGPKELKGL